MSVITSFEDQKMKVRNAVNNVYDIQKLRIANGNRISQSFMQQAGIKPSKKKEDMDKELQKTLQLVLKEYDRITDVYVSMYDNKGRIDKSIKYLGEELAFIKAETDYQQISIYRGLLKQETDAVKIVSKYVESHPMWEAFFKDVVGCGPLMSGVCIGYLDPYKARHVSSFWKYSGVDVLWDEKGFDSNSVEVVIPYKNKKPEPEFITADMAEVDSSSREENGKLIIELINPLTPHNFELPKPSDEDFNDFLRSQDMQPKTGMFIKNLHDKKFWVCYDDGKWFDLGLNPDKHRVANGGYVGRAKRHLEEFDYIDKEGKEKTKLGITYNPFLKTKLVGVLADSFLRCKGCHYDSIYRGYRARIDKKHEFKSYNDAHLMRMAKRYAIKMFLRDMWITWRTLEGLHVSDPYEVAVLGNKPHGYNHNVS